MNKPTQGELDFETAKAKKLRKAAERACRINVRHLHRLDVAKMCAPRGEAACDAFDRDFSDSFDSDDE